MKTYLHSPINYAEMMKLQHSVRYLDLPERRKRYASSREAVVGRRKMMHRCALVAK